MNFSFASLATSARTAVLGLRYLNVLYEVTSSRIQERSQGKSRVRYDTGLPDLGLTGFFGREGAPWFLMLFAVAFMFLGIYCSIAMVVRSLMYIPAHMSLNGVGCGIGGVAIGIAIGILSCWALRIGASMATAAGVAASAPLSEESRLLLQRALAMHLAGEAMPANVTTWLEVAQYVAGFRRRLAGLEKSRLEQVRNLVEEKR